MYKYAREQKVIDIGGVKIGGQIGENPTVVIPSIFYDGQKHVVDPKNNKFDEAKADALVKEAEEAADKTNLPVIFQVVGITPELMRKGLDFMADHTKAPLIFDSADKHARIAGMAHASKQNYASRVIYNAINMVIDDEEIRALKDSKIEGTMILGFNIQDFSVKGRTALLENGGGFIEKGLLQTAKDCGFEKIIYDPGVQPFGQGCGASFKLLSVVKSRYGLPTGVGAHNMPSSWAWSRKNVDKETRRIVDICANMLGIAAGANSLFIGPVEQAKYAVPAIAMADILNADSLKDFGVEHAEKHPYKLA